VKEYERPVRFEDVDAAQIVFFGRFFGYCHEAMEVLFEGELEGGYVGLIRDRKIGFPAVHVECDFKHPLRYGDVARITTTVERIGTKSCTFRYRITRAADDVDSRDDSSRLVDVASIKHVCAVSDLVTITAIPIPADIRAALERHATAP
jgi:4-hydroxybenzoyl-CoA thioesterase